jgi:uncharacterized protein (UPF0332 family)
VKPEAADYLAKARECLDAAIKINELSLPQVAAKEAYLAAFHAAHALIFETTGKVVKSHGGMRTMFAQVAKDDDRIDRGLASLLGRAYKFKEVADYAVGSQGVVTEAEAQGVIDIAQRFVATITSLMPPDPPDPAEVPGQTLG